MLSGCGSGTPTSTADVDETPVALSASVAGCETFTADGPAVTGEGRVPVVRLPCLVGGEDVALDDLGDRPVLVNLWASWCAPCREELPLLQAAYERYGGRVDSLDVDTQDTRSAGISVLVDLDVRYPHVVNPDAVLLTQLAAPGLPVTLAVAADGRVIDRQIGQMSAARIEELVSLLTADDTAPP